LASWFRRPLYGADKPTQREFVTDKSERALQECAMNSPTTGLRVASVVFGILCLGHIIRLINHASVVVGSHHVPMWVSVVALIVAALLCIWMWRLSNLRGIA